MLPADTSLGPVHLTVADLDRAAVFYQTTLGFRIVDHVQGAARLSATGRPPFHLLLTERPDARRGRTAGLYHFAILLPSRGDLARVLRHLVEAQASPAGASDHAVSEALYLHDPEGNGIEIYRDRPRTEWPRRGGELAMGTRPLDLEELLAEDTRAWDGMPAGTRVGHIHLHVADLARSERFYAGVLGFEVTVRGYPGALFLAAGGYHHHIGMNTWAGEGVPPMDPDGLGLRFFTVVIPDEAARGAAVDRLRRAGAEPREVREGPARGWLASDPDGIGLLLAS